MAARISGINIPHANANQDQIVAILNGVFGIAGAIAVLFIIIGGFRYVTSQGNSDAIRTAREMIIYAVVGVVIILVAFSIVQIVIGVVNQK